jgi:hypothetical protein
VARRDASWLGVLSPPKHAWSTGKKQRPLKTKRWSLKEPTPRMLMLRPDGMEPETEGSVGPKERELHCERHRQPARALLHAVACGHLHTCTHILRVTVCPSPLYMQTHTCVPPHIHSTHTVHTHTHTHTQSGKEETNSYECIKGPSGSLRGQMMAS